MNATTIAQLARSTLDGTLPFPEILGRLVQEGVASYRVDFRASQFMLDGAAVEVSQTHAQNFRDFCARALQTGVQSCLVFLKNQRVLYLGRHGDQHVEWFAGQGHQAGASS